MNWKKMVKDLRAKMLLSQEEMASLLGVSFSSINRYENGHYEPTIKVKRKIKELCIEYNIDIDKYQFED